MPKLPGEKDWEGSRKAGGVGSKGPDNSEVKYTLSGTNHSLY